MKYIGVWHARQNLAGLVDQVFFRRQRVVLLRHGREMAAVVPLEDVDRLHRLEVELEVTKTCGPDSTADERREAENRAEWAMMEREDRDERGQSVEREGRRRAAREDRDSQEPPEWGTRRLSPGIR